MINGHFCTDQEKIIFKQDLNLVQIRPLTMTVSVMLKKFGIQHTLQHPILLHL